MRANEFAQTAAECAAGHFERIAADSETLRHLKQFHKPPGLTAKNLQEVAQKVWRAICNLLNASCDSFLCGTLAPY